MHSCALFVFLCCALAACEPILYKLASRRRSDMHWRRIISRTNGGMIVGDIAKRID